MRTKFRILISLGLLVVMITVIGWYLLTQKISPDILLVSVSTDKQEYYAGDIVHISVHNLGDHPIDIFCPEWCALGNFPTTVERFSDGQWQYFAGYCPSIEPLFESDTHEGNYIRHTLSAQSSFELEISNFETLRLEQNDRLRIVYYLGSNKTPIYSNEFTVIR